MSSSRVDVVLVVGGQWHDFEFARRRLLEALGRHDRVRVSVHADFDIGPRLDRAAAVVTYTCNVPADHRQQEQLDSFVARGGRMLALHATNSILVPPEPGQERIFRTPPINGPLPELLGSRFLAHPPIAPFVVKVTNASHPLVRGLSDFEVRDELYVSELHGPLHVLLHTEYSGPVPSFELGETRDDEPRPVLYLKKRGAGEVCYLTLGHCRGRFDLEDLGVGDLELVDRGPWDVPQFNEVLTRTVAWAVGATPEGG